MFTILKDILTEQLLKKIGRCPTVEVKGRVSLALSSYDKRKIIRIASNSSLSLSKIRAQAGVEASKSSVHRVIKSCEYLKYLKLQKSRHLILLVRKNGLNSQETT